MRLQAIENAVKSGKIATEKSIKAELQQQLRQQCTSFALFDPMLQADSDRNCLRQTFG
jgi:Xaa-Pro aminopeptidase